MLPPGRRVLPDGILPESEFSMHPVEYKLLSLLKTGESLCIALTRPKGEKRFSLSLKPAGKSGRPNPDLEQRLAILLSALRNQGSDFGSTLETGDRPESACKWVNIVPKYRDIHTDPDGKLGFLEHAKDGKSSATLRVPALGAVPPPDLVAYASEFVEASAQVECIELKFTGLELKPEWENALGKSLNMRLSDAIQLIQEKNSSAGLQKFMALWLVRKQGWEISIRAAIRRGRAAPRAPLELLGREVFDTECILIPAGKSKEDQNPIETDLSSRFPDGWFFPPLLPPPEIQEQLNLPKQHNQRLPLLPERGMLIGYAEEEPVYVPESARVRHTCIVGSTGTGKSTLLSRMIRKDMEDGHSVILLDPHGDLYTDALSNVPNNRRKDLVTIDPYSSTPPIGFNILNVSKGLFYNRRVDFIIDELINFFQNRWNNPEAFGPMFENYFRYTIELMMYQEGQPSSLLQFEKVLVDHKYREALCETCTRPSVAQFWRQNAGEARGEASLNNIAPYITSKTSPLIQSDFIGTMLGSNADELALDKRIDQPCIILANLSKGALSPRGSQLIGTLLTMQIFAAGLKRSQQPASIRRPVNVYIDEFQNFVSGNVAEMFSEARKFGLRLHVANQHFGQLEGRSGAQNVVDSVLGNVGNMLLFRLGVPDSVRLEKFFAPYTAQQLQELPNFHALTRLITEEGPIRPFVMKTLPQ